VSLTRGFVCIAEFLSLVEHQLSAFFTARASLDQPLRTYLRTGSFPDLSTAELAVFVSEKGDLQGPAPCG
jgi:hypothetical protein